MTKKKSLFLLAAFACCLFTLTACGDDDEPKVTPKATATYTINFHQDLLDAASVIVYYKGENGAVKFEPVSTTVWKKTVSSTKFPAEFAFQIAYSPKDAAELTKDSYNLDVAGSIDGSLNTGEAFYFSRTLMSAPTQKDKVISTLEKHSGKDVMGYTVTKNGTATAMTSINLK